MITIAQLKAWGLAASILASNNQRHLSDATLDGMATAAVESPIIAGDDLAVRTMMAVEVSLAWHEAANLQDPRGSGIGSSDHGQSWCWAQIYLPGGARTREGWTGAELATSPLKCARVTVRLIKASLLASPSCNECGLTFYARGRDAPEGRRLSIARMSLAHRLLREVPWSENPGAAQGGSP